jgi:ferritin
MLTELADYRSKQQSAYLWKPHADSLAYLLRLSQESLEHGQKLITLAQERGLVDKAKAISASLERLQEQVKIVADALRSLGAAS